ITGFLEFSTCSSKVASVTWIMLSLIAFLRAPGRVFAPFSTESVLQCKPRGHRRGPRGAVAYCPRGTVLLCSPSTRPNLPGSHAEAQLPASHPPAAGDRHHGSFAGRVRPEGRPLPPGPRTRPGRTRRHRLKTP